MLVFNKNPFEALINKKPLFSNREIFNHSFVPERIGCRDDEIRKMAGVLIPILKYDNSANLIVSGRPGSGKTVTANCVCNDLVAAGGKMAKKIDVVYIDCSIVNTKYRVLQNVAVNFGVRVPFTGWPTDKVYKALVDAIDTVKRSVVIILDGVEFLMANSKTALMSLSRINENLRHAKVSIISITNNLSITRELDFITSSSFTNEGVVFEPYSVDQIYDILLDKAKQGIKDGVVDEEIIRLASSLAKREGLTDCRLSVDVLRISCEIAERQGDAKVLEEHVRMAIEKIKCDSLDMGIKDMSHQTQLILYSLCKLEMKGRTNRKINTGQVYKSYCTLVKKSNFDRLTSRRVSDLILEIENFGFIRTDVVSRGRYGRTREVDFIMSAEKLKSVLEKQLLFLLEVN